MTPSRPQQVVTLILGAVSAFIVFQSAYTAPMIVPGLEGIRDGASILGKGVEGLANGGRDGKVIGSTHGLGGINDAAHLGTGGKADPASLKNGLFGDRNAGGGGNTVHSSEITGVGHDGTSTSSKISRASHSDHSRSSLPPDKEPPIAAVDSSKDNAVAQQMARLGELTDPNINLVSWEGNLYRTFKAPFTWMLKAYRGWKTTRYMLWLSKAETKLPELRAFVANDDFTIAAGVEKRTWLGHLLFERLGMVDRTREAYVDGVAPGVRAFKFLKKAFGGSTAHAADGAVPKVVGESAVHAADGAAPKVVGGSAAHAADEAVPKAWKTLTTPYRWLSKTVHEWQVNRNTKFAGERTAWLYKYGTDGVAKRFQNDEHIAKIVTDHKSQASIKGYLKKGAALISKPKSGTENAVNGAHGAATNAKGVEQT